MVYLHRGFPVHTLGAVIIQFFSRRTSQGEHVSWAARILATGAIAFLAACDAGAPMDPSASIDGPAFKKTGASCTVDIGTTVHLLPSLHELEAWLNGSIEAPGSSLNCGRIRSLDAKMEALTKALDRTPPNFHSACGVSGALVQELAAMVRNGQLGLPNFEPPFPGFPTDVLTAARVLSERWCTAAAGDLTGPRS